MEIVEKKPLSLAEVKKIIKAREKEGDFEYEQENVKEYVEEFAKIGEKKEKELREKIKGLGVPEETAIKIVEIGPKNEMLLKQILIMEKVELSDEQIKEIVGMFL